MSQGSPIHERSGDALNGLGDLTNAFAQLSEAIAGQVAAAAPILAAIRIGPNRHISGIVWHRDLVITSDQALPAQDGYTWSCQAAC